MRGCFLLRLFEAANAPVCGESLLATKAFESNKASRKRPQF
jgi:hypothetical protein